MLGLKCLTCCGCQTKSIDDVFFDNDKKHPLFMACGHSMCSKCLPTFSKCPICNKRIEQTENYTARAIYEFLTSNPVLVFKNWFHAEVDGPEICSSCHKLSDKLRLCIDCELALDHLHLETRPNNGSPWKDYGKWVGNPIDINLTKLLFRSLFHILPNRLFCSDCILDEHRGHVNKTLKGLDYSETELKRSSSFIASNFLWRTLKEWDSKCLLRKMKMLRICEKLEHLAVHWYPNPNRPAERQEINFKNPSKVNKFFESMDYESGKIIPLEEGDRIITSLEKAVQLLNVNEKCECQEVWDEMHRLHFGNQIEKYFVEVINKAESIVTAECFFVSSEIEETQRKARENYDTRNREYKVDSGVLELIYFYKKNCMELFEQWWKCDVSELGFCLSCASYSDQLEVCVFCEIHKSEIKKALTTKPIPLAGSEYRQNMKLHFIFNGLALFPMRWQCAHCKRRLEADWMHKECNDRKDDDWRGSWNQGCNHLINRVYGRKRCCSYSARADYHEYNAISLKDIDGYNVAMKVATMGLVLRIVKAGIVDGVNCRLWKIRLLSIYGTLNGQIYYYFKNSLHGIRPEKAQSATLKISTLIEHLRKEWSNYKSIENLAETCACSSIWNHADQCLRRKLKDVSNFRMGDVVDQCPLRVDHGIDIDKEIVRNNFLPV